MTGAESGPSRIPNAPLAVSDHFFAGVFGLADWLMIDPSA
jgi:hypothetical protein